MKEIRREYDFLLTKSMKWKIKKERKEKEEKKEEKKRN